MRNFKELKIWQKGFDIAVNGYKLVDTFPKTERYSLSQQITRTAVSILSNIAEGSSRRSEKDSTGFSNFLWDLRSNWKHSILLPKK